MRYVPNPARRASDGGGQVESSRLGRTALASEVKDSELCPECRSWRVTGTAVGQDTRFECLECRFAWLVSVEGKVRALPGQPRPPRSDLEGNGPKDES